MPVVTITDARYAVQERSIEVLVLAARVIRLRLGLCHLMPHFGSWGQSALMLCFPYRASIL